MPVIYNSNTTGQPPQAIPSMEKNEKWKRMNLDWAERLLKAELPVKQKRILKNYNIAQGVIDIEDYIDIDINEYQSIYSTIESEISDSLLQDSEVSADDIKFYPIVPSIINVLVGELVKKFDHITVKAIDDMSVNEHMEYKKQLVVNYIKQKAEAAIQSQLGQVDPNSQEYQQQLQQAQQQALSLPGIQKFLNRTYKSNYEEWAYRILEQANSKYRLDELQPEIFKHQLAVDEAYIHINMQETEINVESWNPIDTICIKNKNKKYTTEADFIGRQYYASISDIVSKNRDKIDKALLEKYNNPLSVIPIYNQYELNPGDYQSNSLPEKKLLYFKYLMGEREFSSTSQVLVTECYWVSFRRMAKLKAVYSGESIYKIVDDYFERTIPPVYDMDKNLIEGEELEYFYIPQIWKGKKLNFSYNGIPSTSLNNNDRLKQEIFGGKSKREKSREKWEKEDIESGCLYLDVEPLEYQYTDELDIWNPKIPVVGCDGFENSMNVGNLSLVDKTKQYQVMFNAALNQMYNYMQTEIGLFYLLDQKLVPRKSVDEGWGKNNWMKFLLTAKETSMGIVDNSSSNTEGGQVLNTPMVVNLLKTEQFKSRLDIAQAVKALLFETIGITPQRMGTISAQETATGVQQAVNNSYAQTEMYYLKHTMLMKEFKSILLDAEKYIESKKPTSRVQYLNSDAENIIFEIDTDDLLLRRYNIWITSNPDTQRVLEQMRQLALNNNTSGATILDLATIIESTNPRDIKDTLQASVLNAQQQQEAQKQHEKELQQQQLQAQAAEAQAKRDFEADQNERDRIARMYQAEVRALGFGKDQDIDGSGVSDVLEVERFNLEQHKTYADILNGNAEAARKNQLEKSKLDVQQQQIAAKDREMTSKERMKQMEIAEKFANQKNDLEIAKQNAKGRSSTKK